MKRRKGKGLGDRGREGMAGLGNGEIGRGQLVSQEAERRGCAQVRGGRCRMEAGRHLPRWARPRSRERWREGLCCRFLER
jgi:hypothetical protein